MMELAFSTLGTPNYTAAEVVDLAVRHGYSGVELRALEGTTDLLSLPDFAPTRLAATRRRFDDAGLALPVLGTSVRADGHGANGHGANGQQDDVRRQADLAAALGTPHLRVFAEPVAADRDARVALYPQVADELDQLAAAVADTGVDLLVETHGTLSRTADLKTVLDHTTTTPAIGVVWDLMHTVRNGDDIEHSWTQIGPRVHHVHLRDGASTNPDGHDYVPTGEGVMPIAAAVHLLQHNGYPGYLSFEWEKLWVPELAEPEIVVPHYAHYLRSLLD